MLREGRVKIYQLVLAESIRTDVIKESFLTLSFGTVRRLWFRSSQTVSYLCFQRINKK